ncbi:MAG: DUF1638 domain-containing protein, partial [Spirochaetales bacterium]|nr:DUF1638 domain-containing protein [Spirochaetales bacterium]
MKKIKIISCAVLSHDLNDLARKCNLSVEAEYLEAGLHEEPQKLKTLLQERVTLASREDSWDRIVIGYGLCGLGTVGLRAGKIPLVIPRVHDCIALFLGSEKKYREQFSRHPGTLYMSRGWYENKTQPGGIRRKEQDHQRPGWGLYEGYDKLKAHYGEENADEIYRFINSWQKKYTRSVSIETGLEREDDQRYGDYARDLAAELNLHYEKIQGSGDLFLKMLTARETSGEILFVPPGHITGYDPLNRGLYSYEPVSDGDKPPWERSDPPSLPGKPQIRKGLGLGIDAGGTYTDGVIYDYGTGEVLAKGKSPTTVPDYSRGIGDVLNLLPADLLNRVDLTVVSTTLATNAIVEGRCRRVGLILMPLGKETGENLPKPWRQVGGRLSIQGDEIEPLDEEEVRRTVGELLEQEKVEAFAVSGYGSTVNHSHENRIRDIIIEETGKGVCCGHELSSSLNFYLRANTAVLNGGIIPLIESFIDNLEEALSGKGISGNIMIVRGDGSLMSREKARTHPVETALSGPAASVSGACYLVDRKDLLVIDVGGTTSDIGMVGEGRIKLTEEGARVGQWRTHVKAVDMETLGTGGDSRLVIEQRQLTVGPERIVPISRLSLVPGWEKALEYMDSLPDPFFRSTRAMEILTLTGKTSSYTLSEDEKRICGLLEERPYCVRETALALGHGLWYLVDTDRLEKDNLVRRYGLTPTDLLCAAGRLDLWDRELARRASRLYEEIWNRKEITLETAVFDRIHRKLLEALILRELDSGSNDTPVNRDDPVFRRLMTRLEREGEALDVTLSLKKPLVGVGAA